LGERAITELRAAVIVDYQNVHLTGHDLFEADGPLRRHETLVDPLHFANQLIGVRNQRQRPGMAHATLSRVLVYRGEPSPVHDPKPRPEPRAEGTVGVRSPGAGPPAPAQVRVRARRDRAEGSRGGRPVHCQGHAAGEGRRRPLRQPDIDLVILASHDSDLDPALDEAAALGTAKVETFCWVDPQQRHRARMKRQTRSSLWVTPLGPTEFANCRDLTAYK
jgi:hypothetical protein